MFDGLLQPTHLVLILVICLLVFGPTKLPQLGRGLGEGIREFKKSLAEARGEPTPAPASAPATKVDEKK